MTKTKYTFAYKIGKGGNGIVHAVKDEQGNLYAKKTLTNIKSKKKYLRFKDEIEVLYQLKNKKGIIEIIDHHFPDDLNPKDLPFYIMPIGISLKDYIVKADRDKIFEIIFELCDIIQFLHTNNITHRDIKPENILILNDNPVLSDFGLANFPKKKRISAPNESIGPKWTIAPEMKRISSTSEYKKADIYSFAKTIWMILTEQWKGFEGQYIPNSNISIDNFVDIFINKTRMMGVWEYNSIVLLERLLIKSTDNNPDNRPSAEEFNKSFRYWHSSNDNYYERNPYEWEDALNKIFPIAIPVSTSWNKMHDIKNILTIIFQNYDNLNHCFYPSGGGNDFDTIKLDNSKEFLIINDRMILKPKSLYFDSIEDLDWSYFLFELEKIEPINEENVYRSSERVFINENEEYSDEELEGYIEYSRFIEGKFLITKKTSMINKLEGRLNAYNALHNKMTNDEYKNLIIDLKTKYKNTAANK
jgi:serine/threonine protein kinase